MKLKHFWWLVLNLLLLSACRPTSQGESIIITLMVDGRERTFAYPASVTVNQFLQDSRNV